MNIDSLEFSVSTEPVSEEVALGNFTKDWDYTRPKRNTKASITFRDSDNLKYYVAKITNIVVDGKEKPEWVGKQIGYSGVGEYDDLLVDGGAYTLSGTSKDASDDIPNFREFGIYPALAAKRNTLAKSLATDKPFLITLNFHLPITFSHPFIINLILLITFNFDFLIIEQNYCYQYQFKIFFDNY